MKAIVLQIYYWTWSSKIKVPVSYFTKYSED